MSIIPVIIPNGKKPTCPSCGKDENRVDVCKHCGYEYKSYNIFGFILACFVGSFPISFIFWIADRNSYKPYEGSYVKFYYEKVILTTIDAITNIF